MLLGKAFNVCWNVRSNGLVAWLRARVHGVQGERLLQPTRRGPAAQLLPCPVPVLALIRLFCELIQLANSAERHLFFQWCVSCSVSALNQLTARFSASVHGERGKQGVRSGGSRLSFQQQWAAVLASPSCATSLRGTSVKSGSQLSGTMDPDAVPKRRVCWWPADGCSQRHFSYCEEGCWQWKTSPLPGAYYCPSAAAQGPHLNKQFQKAFLICTRVKLEGPLHPTAEGWNMCCWVTVGWLCDKKHNEHTANLPRQLSSWREEPSPKAGWKLSGNIHRLLDRDMAFNFIAQGWEGKVEGREGVRREREMRGKKFS